MKWSVGCAARNLEKQHSLMFMQGAPRSNRRWLTKSHYARERPWRERWTELQMNGIVRSTFLKGGVAKLTSCPKIKRAGWEKMCHAKHRTKRKDGEELLRTLLRK